MVSLVEALPSEIIVDITSRLAVKSIINCMLVCKFWKTLIPNPFLAKHNPTYFLLCPGNSARFSILDIDYDDVSKDQVIDMKPSFPGYHTRYPEFERINIFGSCNGLVCFSHSLMGLTLNIYLYNPVLGQFITVPKPSWNSPLYGKFERYAFGFCPVNNHYKVFRSVSSSSNKDDEAKVEIYTLGSPKWRHIGHVSKQIWTRSSPICARGSFHWIWSKKDGQSIFPFNLATEEFGSCPPPPIGEGESMYKLGYIDHSLVATAGSDHEGSELDVWMRKEWTWSKNWVFHDTNIHRQQYLVPVAISGDGIILMIDEFSRELFYLDSKDGCDTCRVIDSPRPRWLPVPFDATLVTCPS